MQKSVLLLRLVRVLFPLSVIGTVYIYFYPFFHKCHFPEPWTAPDWNEQCAHYVREPHIAPFRLLALGDPQLEGDSSLPGGAIEPPPSIPSIWRDTLGLSEEPRAWVDILQYDIPDLFVKWRKQIDLFGNDFYLAHQYRTMRWWTRPSHISVLGDLLGSQWSTDEEYESRSQRFWNRVFKGGLKVSTDITSPNETTGRVEVLGDDVLWEQRLINIVGNHDVGYAGDLDETRVDRFERAFGQVNWDIRFELPQFSLTNLNLNETTEKIPSLHIIVLNSMNLDGPVLSEKLQGDTYKFINDVISSRSAPVEDHTSATLLLTHIPLHKEDGVCIDGPFFDYFPSEEGGGIREQNHLSEHGTKSVLQGIFGLSGNKGAPGNGLGRNGLIVNGHDHEGCDVWHSIRYGEESWRAERYPPAQNTSESMSLPGIREVNPGLREITLRSMMGEFGGYAGLLSAWYDPGAGKWEFAFDYCSMGIQHYWWAIHIVDIVTIICILAIIPVRLLERLPDGNEGARHRGEKAMKRD
ncbi:hypothetical protein EJ05DRAFT_502946 [Pseudovirgaria hyperparasitica]|uniref:Calcineurin-like phosphoesterase domain-containing protein n=1 Tax=Pseudovirgaria hyperparasitica TaxID=470096 RepID=A0A6A6W1N9_9PEZI|nr:uncharacterized protein EJ05DRAFT_502946 [Pseudovirgaria hyperparasitica]KAF2755487.1 hypothetical protein EJ05DRAFT_502946 [Pseudovirgaria hyperparasitica]